MPELTDAQKVLRNDTGKRMAAALEALAGTGGRGLPAGGTDGDVLVKNGATDYAARWTNTPKLMGSLATIEPTSSASKAYAAGDYLVYNGQLYKATGTISPDETLTPGGNISVPDGGGLNDVRTSLLNTAKGRADVLYALGSGTPFTSGSLTIPNISKYSVLSMVMTNGASLLAIVQNTAIVSGGVAGKFGTNDMLIFGINYVLSGSTDTISITSDRRGYVDSGGSNYSGNTVGIRSVSGIILK